MTSAPSFLSQGQGEPVVFLHGLFGTARNWGAITAAFGTWRQAIALDLRNHGAAPGQDTMSLMAMAEDVRDFLKVHCPRGAAVVGHSLGGKVAMLLALHWPEVVERLVVADVAPVSYPPEYRKYAQAMLALPLETLQRRADAETALSATIPDRKIRLFLLQNLAFEEGRYFWRPNLAVIERAMDDLAGFPESADSPPYKGPTLFLRGALSSYIKDKDTALIYRLFPKARVETLVDAGHWLHADQPQAFIANVSSFLQE